MLPCIVENKKIFKESYWNYCNYFQRLYFFLGIFHISMHNWIFLEFFRKLKFTKTSEFISNCWVRFENKDLRNGINMEGAFIFWNWYNRSAPTFIRIKKYSEGVTSITAGTVGCNINMLFLWNTFYFTEGI